MERRVDFCALLKGEVKSSLEQERPRDVIADAVMGTFEWMMQDAWPGDFDEPMGVFVAFAEIADLLDDSDNVVGSAQRKAAMTSYFIQLARGRLRATFPVGHPMLDVVAEQRTRTLLNRLCDAVEARMADQGVLSGEVESALSWETGHLEELIRALREAYPGAPLWEIFAVCSILGMAGASIMMSWVVEISTGRGTN